MFTYKLVDTRGAEIGSLDLNYEWVATQDCSIEGINIYRSNGGVEYIPLQQTCKLTISDTLNVTFDHKTALNDLKHHFNQIRIYKSVRQILDFFEFTLNLMHRIQTDEPKT